MAWDGRVVMPLSAALQCWAQLASSIHFSFSLPNPEYTNRPHFDVDTTAKKEGKSEYLARSNSKTHIECSCTGVASYAPRFPVNEHPELGKIWLTWTVKVRQARA